MNEIQFRATLKKRREDEPSVKDGGPISLQPVNHDYGLLVFNALKSYNGEEVSIEIKDGDSWTERMNRLFHALVRKMMLSGCMSYWQRLGRAPETFEEVKAFCKIELGGAEVRQVGQLTWVESWKEFSKKRASETIDRTIYWCIEQGIDIDSEKLEFDNLRR